MEECSEDNIYTDLLRIHEGSSWMYFKSKPLCEIKLYEALKAQNVICYLPLVKKTTEYQHRIYTRMVPMFGGGYVFASTSRNGFDLARINRNLLKIFYLSEYDSENLLKDLKTVRKYELLAQTHKVEVMTNLQVKEPVVITKGYLKGETAQIKRFKNHETVIVQLTAIPVAMMVELPVDFVNHKDLYL